MHFEASSSILVDEDAFLRRFGGFEKASVPLKVKKGGEKVAHYSKILSSTALMPHLDPKSETLLCLRNVPPTPT